jgi:hypothetical protein
MLSSKCIRIRDIRFVFVFENIRTCICIKYKCDKKMLSESDSMWIQFVSIHILVGLWLRLLLWRKFWLLRPPSFLLGVKPYQHGPQSFEHTKSETQNTPYTILKFIVRLEILGFKCLWKTIACTALTIFSFVHRYRCVRETEKWYINEGHT